MTDLPGKAIHQFYFQKNRSKLYVHDTFGPKVEMPISYYFRNLAKMPELEKLALKLCKGKILDVGAAAGSHALELQEMGKEVFALEISANACEVMVDRGVKQVICQDFFKFENEKFDTVLLLMNGVGIASDLSGFKEFLKKCETLLNFNGQIIFDSSDVNYMFENIQKPKHYYGEVQCCYEYNKQMAHWFQWLFIDQNTLRVIAEQEGWNCKIVYEDQNSQYLTVITKS